MRDHNELIDELKSIVGDTYVVYAPEDLIVFEQDGSVDRALPFAVVLPASTQEVSGVMRAAYRRGMPLVARGAGTGLSGGAIADESGIVLALTRMTRVLEIDADNRLAVVEPRRRQRRPLPRGGRTRAVLRARPLQPKGLHHRRKRSRELRRAPLPGVRRDHQSRAGDGGGARRRLSPVVRRQDA